MLRSDVAVAIANPFVGGEFFQPHGTACVEFLGADGDFCAQAELAAIVEAGRGVNEYGRRTEGIDKTVGVLPVVGEDAFGVFGGVGLDEGDGFF